MKNKKNLSKKDLNDWKEYLKNPKDLIDKDSQSNSTNTNKGRFTFDLHGHSLVEANKKVDEIVKQAFDECDVDNSSRLDAQEFRNWFKNKPEIIDACEELFVQLAWNGPQISIRNNC